MSQRSGAVPAALPLNEEQRLAALRSLCILDTPSEPAFDQLTSLATRIFSVPIAIVSLVDKDRQFFKSVQGTPIRETPRDLSFCAHSLLVQGETIVPDARLDSRFATNPFVVDEPHIRFYASSPLMDSNGMRLGSFCIIAPEPRTLAAKQVEVLRHLAKTASFLIEQRSIALKLEAAQQEIEIASERYLLATRATSDGIWDWDLQQPGPALSARCAALMGCGEKEQSISLRYWYQQIHPADRARIHREIKLQLIEKQQFTCEYRELRPDGDWRWVECSGLLVHDSSGAPQRMVGSLKDVTRARAADGLTGLYHRTSFIDCVQSCMQKKQRDHGPFAILYVDLDHFKRINDSLGHTEGDLVLMEVAERIRHSLQGRPRSCAARISSDEFAILLADGEDEGGMQRYVTELQTSLHWPYLCCRQPLILTASIGIAPSDGTARAAQEMLENADLAMNEAKNNGRACSAYFRDEMRETAAHKVQLEIDLRRALQQREMLLHYQPKVVLRTGKVIGFEALVRWKHPEKGMIPPAEFIPLAEETGLIRELGLGTLSDAIRQAAEWRREGILKDDMNVAVNISGRQIGDAGLVEFIRDQLQQTALPARCLRIEVTESLLLNSDANTGEFFRQIKELGVGIDMDDFGTGYSSLSYLHRFPFDALKVDRSFVQRIDQTEESLSLPRSIVALGRALGMRVLAEGIENLQQLDQLIRIDCGYGQGYLFSRPVPPEDVANLIRDLDGKIRTELMVS